MLQIQHLSKSYGQKQVVNNISFALEAGKILALLGKSGCGKTTTLKMINRLIEPSGGAIFINQQNVLDQEVNQLRRKIGYVIQENGLFPHYTVAQNIAIVPKLLGFDAADINQLIPELLTQLELPSNFASKYPAELSGGQQQRVAIARAIASKPPLLLMDEPFSALDPITRTGVRERFVTLSKQFNMTTVVVTHDVAEAIEMADVICLMNEGKIEQLGTAKELLFQPKNNFVKDFFASNRLETELKVLSIADLLPNLSLTMTEDKQVLELHTQTSLYQVFEQHSTAQVLKLADSSKTLGFATVDQLFQAFRHYKTTASS